MHSDASNEANSDIRWKPLIVSMIVSGMLSYGLCFLTMKSLVGSAGPSEWVFGLSRDNFRFTSFMAGFIFMACIGANGILFALLDQRRRWLTLISAIGLPILGSILLAMFVTAGLG